MRKLIIGIIVLGVGIYFFSLSFSSDITLTPVEKLEKYYEDDIEEVCADMNLPSSYFKALVILESSAEKPAGNRFEEHIYQKLKAVQEGREERYGQYDTKQLSILSDVALRKFATSWGPIQILGYHSAPLGITWEELEGENAIRYGIQWCEKTYGKYLRKKDFRNAFHIHNTGRPFPRSGISETYDPNYISKGMNYIQMFENE